MRKMKNRGKIVCRYSLLSLVALSLLSSLFVLNTIQFIPDGDDSISIKYETQYHDLRVKERFDNEKEEFLDSTKINTTSSTNDGGTELSNNKKNNTTTIVGDGNTTTNHKFAYAFLIAGCNPSEPNYRGYIYNVAIAKELLSKDFGSTNDVIVMIRMHLDSNYDTLPAEDENILSKVGVIVKYLPKPTKVDNFHTAMMDKFRILQFTEYTRVLYLDGDVMPLNNLDYIFELSTSSTSSNGYMLEENLGIAYNNEPVSGGFFMLTPKEGDYERIRKIIETHETRGSAFNQTIGWGQEMIEEWESVYGPKGTKWDFYGSYTDQGLLYYWIKYVKKRLTIIIGSRIKTWIADENGSPSLLYDVDASKVFVNITKASNVTAIHRSRANVRNCLPYRDFHHFKQLHKPWIAANENRIDHGPHEFWLSKLYEMDNMYGFQIENIIFEKPSLGIYPTLKMIEDVKMAQKQ